jgi:hypothetical protein
MHMHPSKQLLHSPHILISGPKRQLQDALQLDDGRNLYTAYILYYIVEHFIYYPTGSLLLGLLHNVEHTFMIGCIVVCDTQSWGNAGCQPKPAACLSGLSRWVTRFFQARCYFPP